MEEEVFNSTKNSSQPWRAIFHRTFLFTFHKNKTHTDNWIKLRIRLKKAIPANSCGNFFGLSLDSKNLIKILDGRNSFISATLKINAQELRDEYLPWKRQISNSNIKQYEIFIVKMKIHWKRKKKLRSSKQNLIKLGEKKIRKKFFPLKL